MSMKHVKILSFFLALALIAVSVQAKARADFWHESAESRVKIDLAKQHIDEGRLVYEAVLQFEPHDKWYSYWRFPGEAGIPLSISPIEGSGVKAVDIDWPLPKRHVEYDITSFAYKGKTLFPLRIDLETDFETNNDYTGEVRLFYMVCNMVCVPQEFQVSIAKFVDIDAVKIARNQALLRMAERHIPHKNDVSDLAVNLAVLSENQLVLALRSGSGFSNADAFVDTKGEVYFTAIPEIEVLEDDPNRAMLKIKAPADIEDLPSALAGKSIHVVVQNNGKAVQREFSF